MPTRIMVECGIPKTLLYQRLNKEGIDFTTIQACLITHSHKDHCVAAHDINRLGVPLFASQETLNNINIDGIPLADLVPTKICDGIYAMAFKVEHDCEGSVGFVIKTKNECVIFVNDHKRWINDLGRFKPDYIFIECNYFHKVVYAQVGEIKKLLQSNETSSTEYIQLKNKYAQHKRNLDSHCSLHGTICGLRKLNLSKCKAIFLMHLSDRYANEYKMKNEVELETHIMTKVCGKDGGIK